MLHSAACEIKVDPIPDCGYFSNSDIVAGELLVDVKRELRVSSIEATLCCEDRGRIYVHDNEEIILPSHLDHRELVWSSDPLIFGPVGQDGYLSKGQHQFNFKFQVPQEINNLPSSCNVEPGNDCNGIFWIIQAVIDRNSRARPSYYESVEVRVLPRRKPPAISDKVTFESKMHELNLKIHSRPSFMISDTTKNLVNVQGKLEVPSNGLHQNKAHHYIKDDHSPGFPVKLSMRSKDPGAAVVQELVVFIDTTIFTLIDNHEGKTQTVAIICAKECNITIDSHSVWQDLSYLISDVQIYGLSETWTTNIHNIKHQIRAQLKVAPVARQSRSSILEITFPVTIYSEAMELDRLKPSASTPPPPPPYE